MLSMPHHCYNRHLTKLHLLTLSLNVHKLAVEGHWMYLHGIHTDVDDKLLESVAYHLTMRMVKWYATLSNTFKLQVIKIF